MYISAKKSKEKIPSVFKNKSIEIFTNTFVFGILNGIIGALTNKFALFAILNLGLTLSFVKYLKEKVHHNDKITNIFKVKISIYEFFTLFLASILKVMIYSIPWLITVACLIAKADMNIYIISSIALIVCYFISPLLSLIPMVTIDEKIKKSKIGYALNLGIKNYVELLKIELCLLPICTFVITPFIYMFYAFTVKLNIMMMSSPIVITILITLSLLASIIYSLIGYVWRIEAYENAKETK